MSIIEVLTDKLNGLTGSQFEIERITRVRMRDDTPVMFYRYRLLISRGEAELPWFSTHKWMKITELRAFLAWLVDAIEFGFIPVRKEDAE
jgi:hypothetical protein